MVTSGRRRRRPHALPIAGDDPQARAEAADLISRLGFDTVDAGPLAESRRFEPETAAYALLYFIDPDAVTAFWARMGEALAPAPCPRRRPPPTAGAPMPAAELLTLLADTPRKLTADRLMA
ncbi:hypothetical protein [Streptomyces caniscabiei]|uniref:hypothetical protein n=1 Tax=Streptomyces caniscabiei TaxID=2746961 RepID=UPI000765D8E4|nr:hypothetical protein [Streptomyces caniscabiei]